MNSAIKVAIGTIISTATIIGSYAAYTNFVAKKNDQPQESVAAQATLAQAKTVKPHPYKSPTGKKYEHRKEYPLYLDSQLPEGYTNVKKFKNFDNCIHIKGCMAEVMVDFYLSKQNHDGDLQESHIVGVYEAVAENVKEVNYKTVVQPNHDCPAIFVTEYWND